MTRYIYQPSLLFTSKLPTLALYSFGGARLAGTVIINGLSTFSWKSLGQLSGSLAILCSLLGAAYFINDLPRALPQNLSLKYIAKLNELNYIRNNADRIAKEVRNVLNIPTREILRSCGLVMDKKQTTKREMEKKYEDNNISLNFFRQLSDRAASQRTIIEGINVYVD